MNKVADLLIWCFGWRKYDISSCDDSPDDRDYLFSEYIDWYAEWLKEKERPYNDIEIFNQWSVPACTRYAITHINNWQNILEYHDNWQNYDQIDPMDIWNGWNKVKTLQAAMSVMRKKELIEWYTMIEAHDKDKMLKEMKQAIDIWQRLYTGSPNWDWYAAKRTWRHTIREDGKFVWHAFSIIDYDDERKVFRCINSRGPNRGIWKGYFVLPYNDINKIYNKYAIIDKDDTGKFLEFRLKNTLLQLKNVNSAVRKSLEKLDYSSKRKMLQDNLHNVNTSIDSLIK